VLRQVGVVVTAEQDAPFLRLIEAAQQVDDGRLAAARRPDKGNRLARPHAQVEVAQHRLAFS
jgi:hypothetical protein